MKNVFMAVMLIVGLVAYYGSINAEEIVLVEDEQGNQTVNIKDVVAQVMVRSDTIQINIARQRILNDEILEERDIRVITLKGENYDTFMTGAGIDLSAVKTFVENYTEPEVTE